ncbi:hypothetical protein Tco_0818986 [Tanacetum coccineum]
MMSEERNTHARETYAPPHKIRNLDLAGLFVNHIRSSFHCDFVSLDPRIKSRKYNIDKSFTIGCTEAVDNVSILQSCNGLLLCTDYAHDDSNFYGCAGLRLAFDPTKSPYYKVEGKLFESRGCLLFIRRDYIGSREFTIYEMRKGCSVWSIKYLVDTDDFMSLLPEGWSIRSIVWSIVLGEREDDSFLVINLSGKFISVGIRASYFPNQTVILLAATRDLIENNRDYKKLVDSMKEVKGQIEYITKQAKMLCLQLQSLDGKTKNIDGAYPSKGKSGISHSHFSGVSSFDVKRLNCGSKFVNGLGSSLVNDNTDEVISGIYSEREFVENGFKLNKIDESQVGVLCLEDSIMDFDKVCEEAMKSSELELNVSCKVDVDGML